MQHIKVDKVRYQAVGGLTSWKIKVKLQDFLNATGILCHREPKCKWTPMDQIFWMLNSHLLPPWTQMHMDPDGSDDLNKCYW